MTQPKPLTKREISWELWRRGNLSWKLDKSQSELYKLFYESNNHDVQTWLLARRSGKTYCLCILALEQCIRKPNSIVKFVSPTKLQVNNNVRPLFKQILEDCPEDLKPEFRAKDYIYYFPNGSEIQLAGTDNGHAEKLRGGDSHIWFVDEAGTCSDLENVVKSILQPTTLITHGKGILASTPPRESEHDFLKFIESADDNGTLIKRTIYDNPRITKEDIENEIRKAGGAHTDFFRREFLCELIKDSKTAVVPEFTAELEAQVVKDWPKPPFYDAYESMDLGFKDMTVILFAYFDFRADKLVVEDEYVTSGLDMQLPALMEAIKLKEKEHWYNVLTDETKKPYLRVSDINYIVTQEISRASNGQISFVPAKKDDKDAALNTMRVMLASRKVIIHPRCKTLIHHLRNVKWHSSVNKDRFARSPNGDHHYDAVDALVYLVRHVAYGKNPYPPGYGMNMKDLYVARPQNFNGGNQQQIDVYRKIFNIKRNP
jgi:PBSX family phage terminase large subunit